MNTIGVKLIKWNFYSILLFLLLSINLSARQKEKSSAFNDATHFSRVFNREKGYRIYLPEGYQKSKRSYPVIYYFHGWGGRHFKTGGSKFEFEMIGDLVDKYQTILVLCDGNMEESERSIKRNSDLSIDSIGGVVYVGNGWGKPDDEEPMRTPITTEGEIADKWVMQLSEF